MANERPGIRTLGGFVPEMEIYSIDEAFLSLAGFETRMEGAHAGPCARPCCSGPGPPVSVGIAPTNTCPRSPPHCEEDAGERRVLALLTEAEQTAALAKARADRLMGLGWPHGDVRLQAIGVTTPLQLRDADPKWIPGPFQCGDGAHGARTARDPVHRLGGQAPARQTIMASRSFVRPSGSSTS